MFIFQSLLIKRLDQFLQSPKSKAIGITNKPELLRHVVNKFLEEQEVLYNKIDYVEDFILEMQDRDHVALPYDNEYQFKEIVNAFIKRGINSHQINVLLIFEREEQKFVESLDKIPNVNSLFNSGEITIIPAAESAHYDRLLVRTCSQKTFRYCALSKKQLEKRIECFRYFSRTINGAGKIQ